MNVVMLGGSSAGKTTYVSLMYRGLSEGVGGFSCRAADPDVGALLQNRGRDVLAGIYPRNTEARQVHDLVLRYQDRDVLPFRWRDYRGSVLTESGASSSQARELHGDLRKADGIVLFAEAPRLLGSGQDLLVRRMTTSVLRALADRDKRLTPLVIVLTKFDLVERHGPAVVDRLKEPFRALIHAAATEPHIRGAVVPLVCGRWPLHVQIPALWVLHSGLVGRAQRARDDADRALELGRRAARQDTRLNRFLSGINSRKSWRSISEEAFNEHRAEEARLRPLLAPADRLDGLLRSVDSF